MTNAGCRTRLAQKTKPRRFLTEIPFANDFKCHGAAQIDVDGLVSDAHSTPTQLDRCPIIALRQLIILKAVRQQLRFWFDRFLKRRLAGLDPASKTLAKHAYRTEFHCSRKLVAAARAGALGLRFHGPNRRTRASQRVKFCPLFGISS